MGFTVTYANRPKYYREPDTREIEYHKQMQSEIESVKTKQYQVIAAKILIAEAARINLLTVSGDIRHKVRLGWQRMYKNIEKVCLRSGTYTDRLSILGMWYPDIPSPAYGRQTEFMEALYHNAKMGFDVSNDLHAHDQTTKLIISSEYAGSCRRVYTEIVSGSLIWSNYIPYSLAIRQRVMLTRIAGRKFISE